MRSVAQIQSRRENLSEGFGGRSSSEVLSRSRLWSTRLTGTEDPIPAPTPGAHCLSGNTDMKAKYQDRCREQRKWEEEPREVKEDFTGEMAWASNHQHVAGGRVFPVEGRVWTQGPGRQSSLAGGLSDWNLRWASGVQPEGGGSSQKPATTCLKCEVFSVLRNH